MPFPEAILIDLDDTILDDSSCVLPCWTDACSAVAETLPGLDPAALQHAVRAYADSWWADAGRMRRGRLDLRAATSTIVTDVLFRLGYDEPAAAARLANHYRDLREERTCLFPGAIETLDHLRDNGVRLGLMTNGAGVAQRAKLERFGLADYFEHLLIEGEFGTGKPDARVYQSLVTALRVDPSKAWAVGDNVEFDVLAPMRLGIFGVWVNPVGGEPSDGEKPDRVISCLGDLCAG